MCVPTSIVNLMHKMPFVKIFHCFVNFYMKKHKLKTKYESNIKNCKHIEESIVDKSGKTLQMSDEAVKMTNLLLPLEKNYPNWYYKMLSLSLMSGCIVGDA